MDALSRRGVMRNKRSASVAARENVKKSAGIVSIRDVVFIILEGLSMVRAMSAEISQPARTFGCEKVPYERRYVLPNREVFATAGELMRISRSPNQ